MVGPFGASEAGGASRTGQLNNIKVSQSKPPHPVLQAHIAPMRANSNFPDLPLHVYNWLYLETVRLGAGVVQLPYWSVHMAMAGGPLDESYLSVA